MRNFLLFLSLAATAGLATAAEVGPEVIESDNASLLGVLRKFVGNYESTLAVKNTTMVHLPMHEGDFSCEQTGEYGSLGGHKWTKPTVEAGGVAPAGDAAILVQAKYVLIGRGCRACIYNEMSGEVATKPIPASKKERLRNWRFLACSEMLDKLRSIGLAESSVTRFAQVLGLSPTGEPAKSEAVKKPVK